MKKVLNLVIIIALLATIPYIYQRANAEMTNQTYEITVPQDEIEALSDTGMPKEEIYSKLAEKNEYGVQRVQGISFEPLTLSNLMNRGIVDVFEKEEMVSLVGEANVDALPDKSGLYFKFDEDKSKYEEHFLTAFEERVTALSEIEVEGEQVFFVEGFPEKMLAEGNGWIENAILTRPITYDLEAIKEANERGFNVVFRISNDITEHNTFIIEQMLEVKEQYQDNASDILFSGSEALGHENEAVKPYSKRLAEAGFNVMSIEFYNQKGFGAYQEHFDNRFIRLHSIDPFDGWDGHVDRAVRAINERNIRAVFFHIVHKKKLYSETLKAEEMLDEATKMIDDIHHDIMNQKFADFVPGDAKPFSQLNLSLLFTLAALIGATALMARVAMLASPLLAWLVIAGGGLLSLAYAATKLEVILQAMALGAAVAAATFAVLSAEYIKKTSQIWLHYLLSAAIGLVGAWFVVALLFGNDYLVKFTEFRGVKVLYLLPMLLIAAHVLRHYIKAISGAPVRYYQLALVGAGLLVVYIYVARSGNDPGVSVSGIELTIRQMLENTLGIRPRTKEFLIGFPLFILGMYLVAKGYKYAHFVYVGAAIGFVSMVNTFTHLHIPLYISFIRTVYGLIFGAIIGLILIGIFKALKKIWPKIQARF